MMPTTGTPILDAGTPAAPDTGARIAWQRRLVGALTDPARYPHPVTRVDVVETHISWVLLAGDHAYKLKKSLNLGFLDFSTLDNRRFACEEELRLNRRTAPDIYIDVVAIGGSVDDPRIGDAAHALEYAVWMHRFARDEGLDFVLARGNLARTDIAQLAAMIADFHAGAERDTRGVYGMPAAVLAPALQNFDQTLATPPGADVVAQLKALRQWTESEHGRISPLLAERVLGGFVRDCHGDLHLANLVRHGGRIVAFDCIEFNPALRRIDVFSDLAFTLMDLHHRGRPDFARLALDTYLERTGDWEGTLLLPFFLAYRAMVRVKVAAIRASEPDVPEDARQAALADCRAHVRLAAGFTHKEAPRLIITNGLSGSGKSHVAAALIEARNWVRVRADVECKRLAGPAPMGRSGAALHQDMYSTPFTAKVYAHLETLAQRLLGAGLSVVVDATFLRCHQREQFRSLAARCNVPFVILAVKADPAEMMRRIQTRNASGDDASEATLPVLEAQTASAEALDAREACHAVQVDTSIPLDAQALASRVETHTVSARPDS